MSISEGELVYEHGNSTFNTSQYVDVIDMFLRRDFEKMVFKNVIYIVAAFGIIGNIMTFIVIVSKLRKSVYVYLANLAIADALFLIISVFEIGQGEDFVQIPYTIYDEERNWWCGMLTYIPCSAALVAILTISWLSVERYMAVCRPYQFKTSKFGSLSRSVKVCAIIWMFSLSVNSVIFAYRYRATITFPWPDMYSDVSNRATVCIIKESYEQLCTISWILQFTVTVLLIVVILVVCFLMIYSLRKSQNITVPNPGDTDPRSKSERKILWTVFVTVTAYVICITPMYVFGIMYLFDILGSNIFLFFTMCRFGIYINSSINPLIYNVVNESFRQAFVDVFFRKRLVDNK
ncbi:neuromedin-U receptor 2-like [Antedon mediterranea]|uniref:neuromedin-U receptor 2-like n=1 Tax=Antedon mediterranea TaxID=105859 RepID=UPI003AF7AAAF